LDVATRVEFDAAARAEFDEAFDWYAERSPGAAMGFAAEVDAAVEQVAADPDRFPRTFAGCQRCSLQRYPYSVVYYRTSSKITVAAIAHAKRRPGYWRDRRSR
jgi:plasmid stabilization system protein ParE